MPLPKLSNIVVSDADSERIQTLRGIACILLVGSHVIGSESVSGMRVADDSWYRAFANFFGPLRMPLFTFLSGFVYAYRPAIYGNTANFASKKLSRLVLPFLTVSTLYYLATFFDAGAKGQIPLAEIWRVYLFSYVHLWFLQVIILIFAATILLERLGALARFDWFALLLAAALIASIWVDPSGKKFFSYHKAIYLAPFFLLGLGANRYRDTLKTPLLMGGCCALLLVLMALHVLAIAETPGIMPKGTALGILIGVTGTLMLLWWAPAMKPLARIGTYSFAIYLFHPFFVAPARKAMQMLQLDFPAALFATGIIVGLAGPTVFEMIVRRIPIARMYLLGLR